MPIMITGRRPTMSKARMRVGGHERESVYTGYASPLVDKEQLEKGKAGFLRLKDKKGVLGKLKPKN